MSNRKTINQAKINEKYITDLRFMGEKNIHLTDTTLSNGQEMIDPRNSLSQNLSKSTFSI